MAHAHAHSHGEGDGTYFQDQLFTVLLSAGIGVVAILMYRSNMLERILVPAFWKPVLAGGITVVLLAVIRAVSLWQLAGKTSPAPAAPVADHGHSHSHAHSHGDEDCGHDHAHKGPCEHDHSHGAKDAGHAPHGDEEEGHEDHDHGWSPWKYIVLAIPIVLFALNLPKSGFSESRLDKEIKGGELQQNPKRLALAALAGSPVMTKALRKTEPLERVLRFKELIEASAVIPRQELYEGDIGTLRGQFYRLPGTDREFTLFRVNMTCCAADSVILETRIVAPEAVTQYKPGDWVSARGVISFQRDEAKKKWVPVITLRSNDDIQPAEGTTDIDGV